MPWRRCPCGGACSLSSPCRHEHAQLSNMYLGFANIVRKRDERGACEPEIEPPHVREFWTGSLVPPPSPFPRQCAFTTLSLTGCCIRTRMSVLCGLHVLRSCWSACSSLLLRVHGKSQPQTTLPFHASCVCVCVCADGGWYDGATTRRQAGELTEIKSSMPIKGCDCNASLIVMWSGRKAEVHQIDLDTGAFVCASACRGWVSERARHRHTDTQTDTQTERDRET